MDYGYGFQNIGHFNTYHSGFRKAVQEDIIRDNEEKKENVAEQSIVQESTLD